MADDTTIDVVRSGDHTVVRPSGYLDVSTSPRLRETLMEVAAEGPSAVILDLGRVEFLDSSALGVILHGWKLLGAAGETLCVVSPEERITKIFEMTGLHLSLGIYPTVEEARAGLGL
jgi:anti-sigma B factor antagonist